MGVSVNILVSAIYHLVAAVFFGAASIAASVAVMLHYQSTMLSVAYILLAGGFYLAMRACVDRLHKLRAAYLDKLTKSETPACFAATPSTSTTEWTVQRSL